MTIDKETAIKLWNDVFGNVHFAQDCFGTWMCRDAYSNECVSMKDCLGSDKNMIIVGMLIILDQKQVSLTSQTQTFGIILNLCTDKIT